jgi:putative acetyltransferase
MMARFMPSTPEMDADVTMFTVRAEQPGDEGAIHKVHASAFPTDLEARLVDALRNAQQMLVSLVATTDRLIVGHVAFSPVAAAVEGGVGLAPVAVLPSYQGRSIGGQLIRAGLAQCHQAGHSFVVVLGDPAYYGRFGFQPAARWGLVDEYGGGDAFQALELSPDALSRGGGLVRYASAFAVVL